MEVEFVISAPSLIKLYAGVLYMLELYAAELYLYTVLTTHPPHQMTLTPTDYAAALKPKGLCRLVGAVAVLVAVLVVAV